MSFTSGVITSPPVWGAKYCDQRVCMFVCLPVCVSTHISHTCPNFTNFLYTSAVAVVRSSDGSATRYLVSGFVDDVMFSA